MISTREHYSFKKMFHISKHLTTCPNEFDENSSKKKSINNSDHNSEEIFFCYVVGHEGKSVRKLAEKKHYSPSFLVLPKIELFNQNVEGGRATTQNNNIQFNWKHV